MIAFVTWVIWFADRPVEPAAQPLPAAGDHRGADARQGHHPDRGRPDRRLLPLPRRPAAELASLRFTGAFAAQLAPVLLVAYITTMFSADIRYGLTRAKLLAETDELTGMLNIRGFAIAANRLFAQALRHERASSVLMIDSDNLKTVNDAYGHDAGNRLLRHVAVAIQAELRFTDVAARYGGDEFIVLLPETPAKGALEVAERIRSAHRRARRSSSTSGASSPASASASPAIPRTARTLDSLAAHADRALYAAKQDGRNKTVKFRAAAWLELQLPEFARPPSVRSCRASRSSSASESGLCVDRARGGEVRVRPEHQLPVALRARERDALLDQAPAKAGAARRRLDEQQPQPRLAPCR